MKMIWYVTLLRNEYNSFLAGSHLSSLSFAGSLFCTISVDCENVTMADLTMRKSVLSVVFTFQYNFEIENDIRQKWKRKKMTMSFWLMLFASFTALNYKIDINNNKQKKKKHKRFFFSTLSFVFVIVIKKMRNGFYIRAAYKITCGRKKKLLYLMTFLLSDICRCCCCFSCFGCLIEWRQVHAQH